MKGSYCLCIKLNSDTETNIGALGNIKFQRGLYIYIGSALNSLIPRLARHVNTNNGRGRAVYWHIDYLLRSPGSKLEEIWATDWAVRMECEIAGKVAEKGEPISRFGCSDCKCESHLYRVKNCSFLKDIGLKKIDISSLATYSPSRR